MVIGSVSTSLPGLGPARDTPVPTSPDRCVRLPSPIAAPMAYKSRG